MPSPNQASLTPYLSTAGGPCGGPGKDLDPRGRDAAPQTGKAKCSQKNPTFPCDTMQTQGHSSAPSQGMAHR